MECKWQNTVPGYTTERSASIGHAQSTFCPLRCTENFSVNQKVLKRLIEKLAPEDNDDDKDEERESSVRESRNDEEKARGSSWGESRDDELESDDDESESKDDDPNCPVTSGSSGPGLRPNDKRFETRAIEKEKRKYYQSRINQIESSSDEDDDEDKVDSSQHINDALKYYGSIKRNKNDPEEVKRLERLSDFDNPSEEAKHLIFTDFYLRDEFSPLRRALRLGKKAREDKVKYLKKRKDFIKKGVPEYLLPPKPY
ncbi:hypothetical protein TKK_0002271 [Trichogramma kaykai]